MVNAVNLSTQRAELEAVLSSGIFQRAPGLALFLTYVCEKYFSGEIDQIKEYNIAVEALHRSPDFDQRDDSIVRVEAHRLRKRLKTYYESEGARHSIRIVIPPGQYVPEFVTAGPRNGDRHSLSILDPPAASPAQTMELAPILELSQPRVVPPPELKSLRMPYWKPGLAGLALLCGAALGAVLLMAHRSPPRSSAAAAVAALDGSEDVRILAGAPEGRFVDSLGNLWMGDRFFHGGQVFTSRNHRVWRTVDQTLFENRREGEFSYDIPLKAGTYELHLYFAETIFGDGNIAGGGESARLFRIACNGKELLEPFDVLSDAGGANLADERVFKDISPAADGFLHLRFSMVKDAPFLNALAIFPARPHHIHPIRIVAQNHSYRDKDGTVWAADHYFTNGQNVLRSEPVAGASSDPQLYHGERYGNFTYTIPVAPNSRYAVRLLFAETWFRPGLPGGGGRGSRVFDVYSNGVALLRDFDICQSAGGANRGIEKIFRGIEANAQGKIILSFVPVHNYACVNAIEVTDEEP